MISHKALDMLHLMAWDAYDPELDFQENIVECFLGFDLDDFRAKLKSLNDGLPVPQPFMITEIGCLTDALAGHNLKASVIRSLDAFDQIVAMERKSGKYFQAAQDLLQCHPSEHLAFLIQCYLNRWHPEQVLPFTKAQLAKHPGWHKLRFYEAFHLLSEDESLLKILKTPLDQLELQQLSDLMLNRQELHQFYPDTPQAFDFLTAQTFYMAQTFFYLRQSSHLERALYALNAWLDINLSMAEIAEEEPDMTLHIALTLFWFRKVYAQPESEARMKKFLA